MKYCCPILHPNKVGDIKKLENVQSSFTSKDVRDAKSPLLGPPEETLGHASKESEKVYLDSAEANFLVE